MLTTFRRLLIALLVIWPLSPLQAAEEEERAQPFARVNGELLTMEQFQEAYVVGAREKFYHGRPPEEDLLEYRVEAGVELVNRTLLLQEARRRGIQPDAEWVGKRVERQVERLKNDPRWEELGESVTAELRSRYEQDNLVDQLKARVKEIPPPNETQLLAYYEAHPDKFSNPGRERVQTILLSVDPSSPVEVWEEQKTVAESVLLRLREGGDFAELASEFSQDPSAENGGDLGYLHKGMLGQTAQQTIDQLQIGETSEVVQLLEGFAIFRLLDRTDPVLNPLERVRERAGQLWQRDEAEKALANLEASLREQAKVTILDADYLRLPDAAETLTKMGWEAGADQGS